MIERRLKISMAFIKSVVTVEVLYSKSFPE